MGAYYLGPIQRQSETSHSPPSIMVDLRNARIWFMMGTSIVLPVIMRVHFVLKVDLLVAGETSTFHMPHN
jgi:hypothetical protein